MLLRDRVEKLKPLSTWKPAWCRVDARLTQPAIARYKEMFPDEIDKLTAESLAYTWKARETACEITPLDSSPLTRNYASFLDTAMCVLMQVHWVNSPFDELKVGADDIGERDGQVHIRAGESDDLGLFVDPRTVAVETRTKGRGVLRAAYAEVDGTWLPQRLVQRTAGADFVVDTIEWSDTYVGARRMPHSLWISVGEDKPVQHSQLVFSDCREF